MINKVLAKSRIGKYNNRVGRFTPLNPRKYKGKRPIVFKSKLEARMMFYLDNNPNVKSWAYEPLPIQYIDRSDNNRKKNYWLDFVADIYINNVLKHVWIEVKSAAETKKPSQKRNTARLLEATRTYVKNVSKWSAAAALAKQRGAEFMLVTEDFFKQR